jgi:hypothetical protein
MNMAYTIKFQAGKTELCNKVLSYLRERMAKEGVFRATLTPSAVWSRGGVSCPIIVVKPVRLLKKKPYCGNHPGTCEINPFTRTAPKKMNATFLEWEDWIKFHSLINRCLNKFRADADVWSTPLDVRGKMMIRKGKVARKSYDWTETTNAYGRPIRIWNQGTPDQF